MVTKTYLPFNILDGSDGSDDSDSSDSSYSSYSSDSSDSNDSSDSSDSSDKQPCFTKKNFFSLSRKHFFFTTKLFFTRFITHQKTQNNQIVKKVKNSNCDETQQLKLW